mgnify:CR=1 FL=1
MAISPINEGVSLQTQALTNSVERRGSGLTNPSTNNKSSQFAHELFTALFTQQPGENNVNILVEHAQNAIQSSMQSSMQSIFSTSQVQSSISATQGQQNALLGLLQSNALQGSASSLITESMVNAGDGQLFKMTEKAPTVNLSDTLSGVFGDDGLGIKDGFDALNLLNHVPIVSEVYQNVSESHVSAASKLTGGLLYGGVTGLSFSALDLAVEYVSGSSISENILKFDYADALQPVLQGVNTFFTGTEKHGEQTREQVAQIDQSLTTAFSLAQQLSR